LAKGVGLGLGIEDEVTSPTFTVVSEYEGRLNLHHVDAYRLSGPADFREIGGEDLLSDPQGLCLIEWSERIAEALPDDCCSIELSVLEDNSRKARIEGAELESILSNFTNLPFREAMA
jgi:tRNA threonylcarbamoyladenosine biosynthesis protein TsaE